MNGILFKSPRLSYQISLSHLKTDALMNVLIKKKKNLARIVNLHCEYFYNLENSRGEWEISATATNCYAVEMRASVARLLQIVEEFLSEVINGVTSGVLS